MNVQDTVSWIKKECRKRKISCILQKSTYVEVDRFPCTGLYDPSAKVIKVASLNKRFVEVLIHEFCHVLQHEDNDELWQKSNKGYVPLNDWLNGESTNHIKRYIGWIRDMELDNERRAVKLIKSLGIKCVNIESYTQKANAYVQFYNWVYVNRSWSKPNMPMYASKHVLEICPTSFTMDYTKIPKRLEKRMSDYQNGLVK